MASEASVNGPRIGRIRQIHTDQIVRIRLIVHTV
jgi:hypothetical protein